MLVYFVLVTISRGRVNFLSYSRLRSGVHVHAKLVLDKHNLASSIPIDELYSIARSSSSASSSTLFLS